MLKTLKQLDITSHKNPYFLLHQDILVRYLLFPRFPLPRVRQYEKISSLQHVPNYSPLEVMWKSTMNRPHFTALTPSSLDLWRKWEFLWALTVILSALVACSRLKPIDINMATESSLTAICLVFFPLETLGSGSLKSKITTTSFVVYVSWLYNCSLLYALG